MSAIEIVAVVFSLLCVLLAIRRNVLNWPAGIIGVGAYFAVFMREKLYADALLQVFFIIQGVYGWYSWHRYKAENRTVEVTELSAGWRIGYIIIIGAISFGWAKALDLYTDASMPYIDALAATISFIANWLMARRKIENWALWIFVDIIYIGLFWSRELYLSFGLYIVFLFMAIAGLIQWKKSLGTSMASS
jgi:nicotinamide mononucleotide transporter